MTNNYDRSRERDNNFFNVTEAIASVLRQFGWEVIDPMTSQNMQETLQEILAAVRNPPAPPAPVIDVQALAVATAQALAPLLPTVDLSSVLGAIQAAQDKLSAGEAVEQADLDNIQATLGPPPTSTPTPPPAP